MSDGRIEYEVRANTDNVSSDLDKVSEEVEHHGSKWDSILQGVGQKIGGTLMDMAAQGVKAAWELGTGFEDGLAKVSTLMDTTVVDMSKVSEGLLDLSGKYGLSAQQMTEAAYNAVSSYSAFANDVDGLNKVLESSARLAAAGFTDIDTASSATLKTMNAYGLGLESVDMIQKVLIQTQNNGITTVGELGSVLSNVTPTAAAMGVSFDQVGAALATMTAQGTPAAQATTQLNSLFAELGKNGTQASQNLEKAAEGTKYAGMSFQEMMEKGVPLNEVLTLMADYASKNNLSMLDMFSSIEAGKAALANTGENAEAFTRNLDAMHTQTDVVGESFDKVSSTSSYQLQQTLSQLQAILINLFQAFAPIIQVVLQLAGTLVQAIGTALGPFMQAIQPIIDIVVKLGEIFAEVIGNRISSLLQNAVSMVTSVMDAIKSYFSGLIDFISGVFTGNWEKAWNGVVTMFKSIISAITGIFKAPINFIIDGINSFIRGINNIKIPDWVPLVGGKGFHIGEIPRLRVGLDYVPSDDFPALLHRGEAVLTAAEASAWRNGTSGNSIDLDRMAGIMVNAMSRVQIPVYLDGHEVGRGVEPYISQYQAGRLESMQRSGFGG